MAEELVEELCVTCGCRVSGWGYYTCRGGLDGKHRLLTDEEKEEAKDWCATNIVDALTRMTPAQLWAGLPAETAVALALAAPKVAREWREVRHYEDGHVLWERSCTDPLFSYRAISGEGIEDSRGVADQRLMELGVLLQGGAHGS